jgi:hypothetical protein
VTLKNAIRNKRKKCWHAILITGIYHTSHKTFNLFKRSMKVKAMGMQFVEAMNIFLFLEKFISLWPMLTTGLVHESPPRSWEVDLKESSPF